MSESESDFLENSPPRSLGRGRGRGRACGRIISKKRGIWSQNQWIVEEENHDLLRRDVDNAVDDLPVADQYDCEEEDQESGQTREGSAPPDFYPYIRETWSEYVLKFFESTRRPKNMQYQLLGDF